MKIKKALIIILAAFIMLAANVYADAKINSVTMNPANPTFGDEVTVAIDYCADLYLNNQMALAISSQPERTTVGYTGVGQVFVISEKGLDVPTEKPADIATGDIDYLANTENGYISIPPCTDCAGNPGQSYVKEYVIHIPEKDMYPQCNISEMYLHLVMKNANLRDSEWVVAADCSSESLTWTPAVSPADFYISTSVNGVLKMPGDLVLYEINYEYSNGPLSISAVIPGSGNLEFVECGPGTISGGGVTQPAVGSTSGTVGWVFPNRTGVPGPAKGTVYILLKMKTQMTPGTNVSLTAQGQMNASVKAAAASTVVAPVAFSITKSQSSAFLMPYNTVTYTLTYQLEDSLGLRAFRNFDNFNLGDTYNNPSVPAGWSSLSNNGSWEIVETCSPGDYAIKGSSNAFVYPIMALSGSDAEFCEGEIYAETMIAASYEGADANIVIRQNNKSTAEELKSYSLVLSTDDFIGSNSGGNIGFQKCDGLTCSWPLSVNVQPVDNRQWYSVRIQVPQGSPYTFNAKVWLRGDPEPAGWMISWTDPSPSGFECNNGDTWTPGVVQQGGDQYFVNDTYDNFMVFGPATGSITAGLFDTLPAGISYLTSAATPVIVTGQLMQWAVELSNNPATFTWMGMATSCGNVTNQAGLAVTGSGTEYSNSVVLNVPCLSTTTTFTPTITITPSAEWTKTVTPTFTPTITYNLTLSLTNTRTRTPTVSATSTPTTTRTPSPTVTITASVDLSITPTLTPVATVPADSFPGDDIIINPLPGDNGGRGSCLDNNGNLIVVALEWDDNCTCYVTVLYRYLPDGSIDTSFGNNGRMVCPGPSTKYVWGDSITVKCDSSGNIIVAGTVDPCGGTCSYGIIYRFLSNGTPDTSFNAGQCFRTYGSGNDYFYDFDIDSNGRYVCVGKSWNGTDYDACVTRINPNSTPDTTFGPLGCRKIHNQAGGNGNDCALTIKCIGTEILVSGWSDSNDPGCTGTCRAMCTWKFLNDGSLDSAFGTGGCTSYINTVLNHKNCVPKSMIITVGGKIVITGYVDDGSGCTLTCRTSITIVLNADGTFDTGFDSDGILTAGPGEEIRSVIEIDGKLVILYVRHNGSDTDCVVKRFNMDGTLDTTFGTAGEWVYDSGYDDECYSVLRLTICRLLVTGHTVSLTTGYDQVIWNIEDMCPPHTPTSTITLTAVLSPTFTITPTATVTATTTVTKTATTTITATASSTRTFTCTVTQTSTITVTITPTFTPTMTITAQPTLTSTPLPCDGVTPPSFTVKMIFNPEHTDNIYFQITSNVPLMNPPSIDVYPHGGTENKDVLSFVSTLVPGQDMVYRVLYPKQTGFGDIDRIVVKGQDICGVWGTSSGKFDKEVISEKDIKIFNNVIEPDKGERVTIMFNVYSGDNVKVKVYTRTGVLVATLFDGVITQVGTKELYWEGKNDNGNIINSGTYLITVETSHYKATEKVAVVR